MLYHINKRLKLWVGKVYLLKRIIVAVVLMSNLIVLSSCTILTKHLDSRTGFSNHLAQTEQSIRNEDWQQAKRSLEDSKKAWKKLKPIMQVDIDHDYIKDVEDNFTKLGGYLDTQDISDSLSTILLIEDTWENIDSI